MNLKKIKFTSLLRKFVFLAGIVFIGLSIFGFVISVAQTEQRPIWSESSKKRGIEMDEPGKPGDSMRIPGTDQKYYKNLRIIEFDEYGDFWNSKQLLSATKLIGKVDNSTAGTPVIVFVHGWRHDADPKPRKYGNDLLRFNNFLEKYASDLESVPEAERHGDPVGIFIGWRGRTVKAPGLEYLSFPTRRIATNRIAASTAFSRCMWDIRRFANRNRFKTRVVLIGHSLGGRILERVASPPAINYANTVFRNNAHPSERNIWNAAMKNLAQASPQYVSNAHPSLQVCDDYINDRKSGVLEPTDLLELREHLFAEGVSSPGLEHGIDLCLNGLDYRNQYLLADLVLLINPASEAIQARQLKLATDTWRWDEPPAVISLTSESDDVTGGILPVGKRLEKWVFPTVPLTENEYSLGRLGAEFQSGYLEHTSGHDRRIVSGFVPENGTLQEYPKIYECLCDKFLYDGVVYKDFDRTEEAKEQINKDKVFLEKMGVKINRKTDVSGLGVKFDHGSNTIYFDKTLAGEAPLEAVMEKAVNKLGSNKYLSHKLPVGGYLVLRVDSSILDGHGGNREDNGIFNDRMQKVCLRLLQESERSRFKDSDLEKFIWQVDYDYKKRYEKERAEYLASQLD
ncbi:MAG: hypothetical protein P1V20_24815 [Verrucomicrobiales bacterium]|nr:hypothetical protein [Verrucomicrobiales bacterium]